MPALRTLSLNSRRRLNHGRAISGVSAVGVSSIDALFEPVPERVRLQRALDLPPAASEPDLMAHLAALAAQNADATRYAVFLGAGAYRHVAPAFVDQLLLRSEFYTAYTPYQPEISQGRLEALINFQTMVTDLTGLATANASMLDESTAVVEGMLVARRASKSASNVFLVDADALPQTKALRAHRALGCLNVSRVDIIIDAEGVPQVLELNISPGMTETSLLPMAAEAAGMEFKELVRVLVRLAMEKYA